MPCWSTSCSRRRLDARGRVAVLGAVRAALEEARLALCGRGTLLPPTPAAWRRGRARSSPAGEPALRPVINATGILLHTGLGRAPLAAEAIAAVTEVARGYCNLELDLEDGTRGRRTAGIAGLLRELTGAEAATAVNNNAGATVLALQGAGGRARGDRLARPARRDRRQLPAPRDLRGLGRDPPRGRHDQQDPAVGLRSARSGPQTAAILRVHRSNFRIVGFTEDAELAELVQLAHAQGLWMIDDIGSGALGPGRAARASATSRRPPERSPPGPTSCSSRATSCWAARNAGSWPGPSEAVGRIEADPLMRALRLDKMTLAALEATLRLAMRRRSRRRANPALVDDRHARCRA